MLTDALVSAYHFIGKNDGQEADGHALLSQRSFRTLRSLARLSTGLARIREARQLSNAATSTRSRSP